MFERQNLLEAEIEPANGWGSSPDEFGWKVQFLRRDGIREPLTLRWKPSETWIFLSLEAALSSVRAIGFQTARVSLKPHMMKGQGVVAAPSLKT